MQDLHFLASGHFRDKKWIWHIRLGEKEQRVYLCLQQRKVDMSKVEMTAFKEVCFTFSRLLWIDLKKASGVERK